jgi:predicted DNA binding CopG/RHH family protein
MYEKSILVKCNSDYKESVKSMAKARGMSISEFVRFLIEKQKEADRK